MYNVLFTSGLWAAHLFLINKGLKIVINKFAILFLILCNAKLSMKYFTNINQTQIL